MRRALRWTSSSCAETSTAAAAAAATALGARSETAIGAGVGMPGGAGVIPVGGVTAVTSSGSLGAATIGTPVALRSVRVSSQMPAVRASNCSAAVSDSPSLRLPASAYTSAGTLSRTNKGNKAHVPLGAPNCEPNLLSNSATGPVTIFFCCMALPARPLLISALTFLMPLLSSKPRACHPTALSFLTTSNATRLLKWAAPSSRERRMSVCEVAS